MYQKTRANFYVPERKNRQFLLQCAANYGTLSLRESVGAQSVESRKRADSQISGKDTKESNLMDNRIFDGTLEKLSPAEVKEILDRVARRTVVSLAAAATPDYGCA